MRPQPSAPGPGSAFGSRSGVPDPAPAHPAEPPRGVSASVPPPAAERSTAGPDRAPRSGIPAEAPPAPDRDAHRFPHPRPGAARAARSGPTPPPPAATARFPDAPPAPSPQPRQLAGPAGPARTAAPGDAVPGERSAQPAGPDSPPRAEASPTPWTPVESFTSAPAPAAPERNESAGRPFVSFAEPETGPLPGRPRTRSRAVAAAVCVVLGLGLIGGAVTGSWLTGGEADAAGSRDTFAAAGDLWHSVPVDRLFPPTVRGDGAGPGGSDRTWTRIAVAPDTGCAHAFDPLLRKALAPVGCLRLLRATYVDATRSHVTTVGLLFTTADAAAMTALKARFGKEGLDRRSDLMPRTYPAKGTPAEGFGDAQRASWTESVLTDAPVVVFAVSGFADGRAVAAPQPAADAMEPGATTAPAQAGLGHEARGLADRVERAFRKTVTSATENPS
ncbi:hypothetical protein ACGFS9_05800 [Streptomyces sp. NPDC048566]|uniref:hypothetical protein n=1 Tax=Streptomyces sp. NPDC048566 TaxID=3365569 RepID=UPI00371EB603